MSGIVLGYIGVHQIYQLALAAQEQGLLQQLFCSFNDAPGSWGRVIARWGKAASLHPLGADQIRAELVTELPMALLARRMRQWLLSVPTDYQGSNEWFDRSVARRLSALHPGLFVGTETCALECLRLARRNGILSVLDCPGIPGDLLVEELAQAGEELGIPFDAPSFSGRAEARKLEERCLADHLFVCSELQREWYVRQGVPSEKLTVNPLWVDPLFANTERRARASAEGAPLRVLFVGHATLAKGAPYALQAMDLLGPQASLTICGGVDASVRQWAGERLGRHRVIPWVSRAELSGIYQEHDVLLFPSLGDSFGFVALEAMACGLPVILSQNVGAPVPADSWRVPVRAAQALAARLTFYAKDRSRLEADAVLAQAFARTFTPEQFRKRAGETFQQLLA